MTVARALRPGDRVTAARNLGGPEGPCVRAGTKGTVAEDRGSTLVVSFDTDVQLCSLDERDLVPASA